MAARLENVERITCELFQVKLQPVYEVTLLAEARAKVGLAKHTPIGAAGVI
jgi:hypothetical protein